MTDFLLQYPLAALLLKLAVGSSLLLSAALILARWNRCGPAATRCLVLQTGLIGVLFLPLALLLPGQSAVRSHDVSTAPEPALRDFDYREEISTQGARPFVTASETNAVTTPSTEGASTCLLYTSPSPRDQRGSRMPSSA